MGPPRKIGKIWAIFGFFRPTQKMGPNGPRRIFVPTNPDLADILGRTDFDFENFHVIDLLDPKFLDFQVPRSPNCKISRFPDFQTPPPNKLSDPNLTPLPTHPGIKYVARALAATNGLSASDPTSSMPRANGQPNRRMAGW